ncbi:hypothetical protein MTR67_008024 [Solanum verrucosum]|uniref:Uncharacterized protein n=1 Tax=Solanum verrucosum TaxID=315347 RepID=A0AAF0Q0P0_SOLVR|nr:hypothetical protein MTR67_008024 [Solanum verrucosum]
MGFGLCRSKMMNGIVALHSPPMRKDAAEKNGTNELFTLKFKHIYMCVCACACACARVCIPCVWTC